MQCEKLKFSWHNLFSDGMTPQICLPWNRITSVCATLRIKSLQKVWEHSTNYEDWLIFCYPWALYPCVLRLVSFCKFMSTSSKWYFLINKPIDFCRWKSGGRILHRKGLTLNHTDMVATLSRALRVVSALVLHWAISRNVQQSLWYCNDCQASYRKFNLYSLHFIWKDIASCLAVRKLLARWVSFLTVDQRHTSRYNLNLLEVDSGNSLQWMKRGSIISQDAAKHWKHPGSNLPKRQRQIHQLVFLGWCNISKRTAPQKTWKRCVDPPSCH